MKRLTAFLSTFVILTLCVTAQAMESRKPHKVSDDSQPRRLLVTLKNPSVPLPARGGTLEPVYRDWVRTQKQTGRSAMGMFNQTKSRFSRRASRARLQTQTAALDLSRTYRLTPAVRNPKELQAVADELRANPNVASVEVEKEYTVQLTPNDPYYASKGAWGQTYDDLYGMKSISAAGAWDIGNGAGVIVAIVDTGIDYNHPDLAANVWTHSADGSHGYDTVNEDNAPMDDHGHGTHVAGTVAAVGQNNIGVIGVAYGSKVMGVKALSAYGSGYSSDLAEAIVWATDHGADVINMSWGQYNTSSDAVIDVALQYAYAQGVVLVAAAGNSSMDAANFYPANSPLVITVSAFDWNDQIASFSNYGNKIDVAAPGVNTLSLQAAGTQLGPITAPGYMYISGTSMAAPHVAGAAALILGKNPSYSNEQVRQLLRSTADDVGVPGFDQLSGYGRMNVARLLQAPTLGSVIISSPKSGSPLGSTFPIYGTAKGDGFVSYQLFIGVTGSQTNFVPIGSPVTTPVTDGLLGTGATDSLVAGSYQVKLVVTFSNQTYSMSVSPLWVDRSSPTIAITTPQPNASIVNGVGFPIDVQVEDDARVQSVSYFFDEMKLAEQFGPSYVIFANPYAAAGVHTIRAAAKDMVGKTTSVSQTITLVADTAPPTAPGSAVLSVPSYGGSNQLILSWTSSTDNGVITSYSVDLSTQPSFATYVAGYQNLNVGLNTQAYFYSLTPMRFS